MLFRSGFYYNDGTSTSFKVYIKSVTEGEQVEINTNNWTGVFVLSSDITFETVIDILPPPGVVIHNSKAATLKYVGSPSITVLEDGTYLASHDIFGGVISYQKLYEATQAAQGAQAGPQAEPQGNASQGGADYNDADYTEVDDN